MSRIHQTLLIIFIFSVLTGCNLIGNYFEYRDTTKALVNEILKQDYDNAVKRFALEHPSFGELSEDTLKSRLPAFRDVIVNNFGDDLDYTMMTTEKKWSTDENESTPPNTTIVLMQFANDKDFGILKVWFDDNSKKVIFIKTLDLKRPIPDLMIFWLFGLLALCIPVFNIFMIVKVKRSQFKNKWLKYLAIVLLNVPSFTYNAVTGFSFSLLSFQLFLGIGVEYLGYLNSSWTVGLPIGGIYIYWKLRNGKDKSTEKNSIEPLMDGKPQ